EQAADALLQVGVSGGEDHEVGRDDAPVGESQPAGFEPVDVARVPQCDGTVGDQVGAADVDVVAAALAQVLHVEPGVVGLVVGLEPGCVQAVEQFGVQSASALCQPLI